MIATITWIALLAASLVIELCSRREGHRVASLPQTGAWVAIHVLGRVILWLSGYSLDCTSSLAMAFNADCPLALPLCETLAMGSADEKPRKPRLRLGKFREASSRTTCRSRDSLRRAAAPTVRESTTIKRDTAAVTLAVLVEASCACLGRRTRDPEVNEEE